VLAAGGTGLIVLAYLSLHFRWEVITGAVLLTLGSVRPLARRAARARLTGHVFAAVQPLLGLPAGAYDARSWVSVPAKPGAEDATVRLELPAHFTGEDEVTAAITRVVNRLLPGKWEAAWHYRLTERGPSWWRRIAGIVRHETPHVLFRHPPEPPAEVTFAEMREAYRAGPEHLVPIGKTARGEIVRIDVDGDAPHVAYDGSTGAGKSTFLRGVISFLIRHGAEEVIILDPKRISLSKPFRDVPNVRIVRDSADWPAAIAEVKARMQARYQYAERQQDEEAAIAGFRRLVLVVEEGGSLTDMLRADWKASKGREDPPEPPAITDLRHILFQGRQGKVTVVMVLQQGNARDMGGSAVRAQFAARVLVRYGAASWRMLVGTAPIPRAPKHRGRGYVVIGDEDELVQLTNISSDEARQLALEGNPAAPDHRLPDTPAGHVTDTASRGGAAGPEREIVPDSSPDSTRPGDSPPAGDATVVRPLRAAPRYLTQAEVAAQLGMNVAAFTKWRSRCKKAGAPLPEPAYFAGRPGWTDDQLEVMAARRSPWRGAS
jgi:hypothetical protein